MFQLEKLTDEFVIQSKQILGDNLTGIYLHGSAVMGCFNDKKSDIDLLVVVKNDIPKEIKKQYMDMVIELNKKAPEKGLELSIVKESVCNPFVYPFCGSYFPKSQGGYYYSDASIVCFDQNLLESDFDRTAQIV